MLFIVRDDRALRFYFIGRGLLCSECGFPYFQENQEKPIPKSGLYKICAINIAFLSEIAEIFCENQGILRIFR